MNRIVGSSCVAIFAAASLITPDVAYAKIENSPTKTTTETRMSVSDSCIFHQIKGGSKDNEFGFLGLFLAPLVQKLISGGINLITNKIKKAGEGGSAHSEVVHANALFYNGSEQSPSINPHCITVVHGEMLINGSFSNEAESWVNNKFLGPKRDENNELIETTEVDSRGREKKVLDMSGIADGEDKKKLSSRDNAVTVRAVFDRDGAVNRAKDLGFVLAKKPKFIFEGVVVPAGEGSKEATIRPLLLEYNDEIKEESKKNALKDLVINFSVQQVGGKGHTASTLQTAHLSFKEPFAGYAPSWNYLKSMETPWFALPAVSKRGGSGTGQSSQNQGSQSNPNQDSSGNSQAQNNRDGQGAGRGARSIGGRSAEAAVGAESKPKSEKINRHTPVTFYVSVTETSDANWFLGKLAEVLEENKKDIEKEVTNVLLPASWQQNGEKDKKDDASQPEDRGGRGARDNSQ